MRVHQEEIVQQMTVASVWRKLPELRRNRNENDLLLSGSGSSVERSWRRQVDAATARVVARQGSFGAENLEAKGNVKHHQFR